MRKHPYFQFLISISVLIACADDTTTGDEIGDTGTDTGATGDTGDTDESASDVTTTADDTTTDDTTTDDTTDTTDATDTTDTTDTTDATDTTDGGPVCGDGNVDMGEECDDANMDDTDACTSACLTAVCGDGFVQMGVEGCDDANLVDGDGCSAMCVPESCGDGVVQGMEACDDGNMDDTDDCTSLCAAAACGDGFVWAGNEACDDGENGDNTDDCIDGCIAASCGDTFVWAGNEDCDDGENGDNHDDCLDGCTAASCGDGFINAGVETCDEGDSMDGGGCSSVCEVEFYFKCSGEGPNTCNPIRILYAPADADTAAYRMAIAAVTTGVADYFDARAGSPTLAQLTASYDCVFTHPNYTYNNSMTMGTVLKDYVDAGGSVVLGIATDFNPATGLNGTPIMANGYAPINTAGGVTFGAQNYSGNGMTVIFTNVMMFGLNLLDTSPVVQGMGVADGTYGNGVMAAAYRPDFKVVYLNGTGDTSFGPTGQWGLLTANACAAGYAQ